MPMEAATRRRRAYIADLAAEQLYGQALAAPPGAVTRSVRARRQLRQEYGDIRLVQLVVGKQSSPEYSQQVSGALLAQSLNFALVSKMRRLQMQGTRFSRVVEPLLGPIDSILASVADAPPVGAVDEEDGSVARSAKAVLQPRVDQLVNQVLELAGGDLLSAVQALVLTALKHAVQDTSGNFLLPSMQ